jgi:hypothetical protein
LPRDLFAEFRLLCRRRRERFDHRRVCCFCCLKKCFLWQQRKDNYVPERSAIDTDNVEIDADTKEMLKRFNMHNIAGLQVRDPAQEFRRRRPQREQRAN